MNNSKAVKALIKRFNGKIDTREKSKNYLINVIKTHNRDGSLTKEYGGHRTDGEEG